MEQWAFALVWFAGPIALLLGIILTFVIGQSAIAVGIVIQALSRAIVAAWTVLRPEAQMTKSPVAWRLVSAALWVGLAYFLITVER